MLERVLVIEPVIVAALIEPVIVAALVHGSDHVDLDVDVQVAFWLASPMDH